MIRRLGITLSALLLTSALAAAQPPPDPNAEFVPASSLPPSEQMAAAPLLVASYAVFLVLMMAYLWSIWRRLGKVEKDMQDLARRQGSGR